MPIEISKEKLCSILKASSSSNSAEEIFINGVEFDSIRVRPGQLFFAIQGEVTHGHSFVDKAQEAGAELCVIEDLEACKKVINQESLIVVDNSLKSFWTLAAWWREQLTVPFTAITGSVGKTTVKEMAKEILAQIGAGTASEKSYNNHTGVPYTLCKVNKDDAWAVLEIGMSASGEIKDLSNIVKPNVAAITKIAPSHAKAFKSIDEIADAKCEIIESLNEQGILVINNDDQVLKKAVARNSASEKVQIRTFGESNDSDLRVANIHSKGFEGVGCDFIFEDQNQHIKLPLLGKHNILNAAAASLIAISLLPDLTLEQIAEALEKVEAAPMRMNLHQLKSGQVLLDDSYNANPASMTAMLEFAKERIEQGDKVGFVLGDMLELGELSNDFHQQIAEKLIKLKPEFIISVGKESKVFSELALRNAIEAEHVNSVGNILENIKERSFDVLCIKGSRAIGLDRVVRNLLS